MIMEREQFYIVDTIFISEMKNTSTGYNLVMSL